MSTGRCVPGNTAVVLGSVSPQQCHSVMLSQAWFIIADSCNDLLDALGSGPLTPIGSLRERFGMHMDDVHNIVGRVGHGDLWRDCAERCSLQTQCDMPMKTMNSVKLRVRAG